MSTKGQEGVVYLICLSIKLHHSKHYIGWSHKDKLSKRIKAHRNNSGSRFLRACNQNNIDYKVTRVWRNKDGNFERYLKNMKSSKYLCPCCNPETWRNRGKDERIKDRG